MVVVGLRRGVFSKHMWFFYQLQIRSFRVCKGMIRTEEVILTLSRVPGVNFDPHTPVTHYFLR